MFLENISLLRDRHSIVKYKVPADIVSFGCKNSICNG